MLYKSVVVLMITGGGKTSASMEKIHNRILDKSHNHRMMQPPLDAFVDSSLVSVDSSLGVAPSLSTALSSRLSGAAGAGGGLGVRFSFAARIISLTLYLCVSSNTSRPFTSVASKSIASQDVRSRTLSSSPCSAAYMSELRPCLFLMFGSAPASIRNFTTAACSPLAASISAVLSFASKILSMLSALIHSFSLLTSPFLIAFFTARLLILFLSTVGLHVV